MNFRRIDFASLAVEGLASAVSGGLQEWAWRPARGGMMGFLATGGALIGGVALKSMTNGGMMQQLGNALFLSGATVTGIKVSERVLPGGAAARLPAGFGRQAFNPAMAIHPNALAPRPAGAPSFPGAGLPRASLSTVNPNTGEQILASRI